MEEKEERVGGRDLTTFSLSPSAKKKKKKEMAAPALRPVRSTTRGVGFVMAAEDKADSPGMAAAG